MIFGKKRLRAAGVLGLNRRNVEYLLRYNKRLYYPRVDDKIVTKELAAAAGVAVPQRYAVVESVGQLKRLGRFLDHYQDFVIKPAKGSGGDGILVVTGRVREQFRRSSGRLISERELCHHVSNVLSGIYSLGGHADRALIEYRVRPTELFEEITYRGVPDIRIIVFLGVPVMAMVRLPTLLSDGKANLHQGAIGVGIDIGSGRTLSTAVWQNRIVTEHPDTGNVVTGREIPEWEQLLSLAAQCYEVTSLGYQGVDLVLDRDLGPLLLEINARPGLSIQIANCAGLLPRLERVAAEAAGLKTLEDRVCYARSRLEEDAGETKAASP